MAKDEKMIAEITNGMESIRLPSDDASNGDERMESILLEAAAEGQANVVAKAPPREELVRPFDVVRNAGPAHHPISFPPPIIDRGVRDNVLCYNQRTQRFIKAENVLFRDYSRDGGDADSALQRVERAFWPVPHKEKIKTIMGMSFETKMHVLSDETDAHNYLFVTPFLLDRLRSDLCSAKTMPERTR